LLDSQRTDFIKEALLSCIVASIHTTVTRKYARDRDLQPSRSRLDHETFETRPRIAKMGFETRLETHHGILAHQNTTHHLGRPNVIMVYSCPFATQITK